MGARLRAALLAPFAACDPLDVSARMVFALFLLSTWVTTDLWYWKLPLRVLALVALVLPPLHRDARLWAAFAALLLTRTWVQWFTQDNHLFLLGWFALGTALALRAPDPLRAARECARLLIGLTFLFAALWKGALSPEFLDGGYFTCTFLTDPRFHGAARVLGGVPDQALARSYGLASELFQPGTAAVALEGLSPRLLLVSRCAAWWTLAIEAGLALCFLAPAAWERTGRARHVLLWTFGLTTYLVIDIKTFGWTLMAVGAAQAEPERPHVRALYFAVGLAILALDYVPVLDWLAATGP